MEKYIAPDRKRIPYGMMNFAVIRRDDCYYVDKTRFIPMIEEADKFFFFIRPRRFGKSLTVNMLQHYYDILAKDKFEALFGDLYIGKHPTRDRNSYLVLYLNFSGIVGELHNYRKGLDAHCQTMFDYFCDIYADYLPKGIKEELDKKEGATTSPSGGTRTLPAMARGALRGSPPPKARTMRSSAARSSPC